MRFTDAAIAAVALAARSAQAGPANPVNEVVYEIGPRQAGTTIAVDPGKTYQKMDGFGFSLAFQRANLITNLKFPQKQRELLDLLFNRTTGAGFSIVRNGIGSSPDSSGDHMNTFAPKSPGSPDAKPNYQWDGKDSGQLWVSQQAVKDYGVTQIYNDAWSAPGYMKSNNNENNGGSLKNEWRQAYANYLVANVLFYKEAGVNVTHLGFLNEPEFSASYASMNMNGAAAADFTKILYKTLQDNNLTSQTGVVCCESEGWGNQVSMTNAIKSAGAETMLKAVTSHTYTGGPSGSINTKVPVWLSEQCDLNGQWSTGWSGGGAGDGMTWANNIMNPILNNNLGGYLYWEGVQWPNPNTNEKLIRVDNGTGNYDVAKRLWAFAQFSRYVRPGATRIGASGSGVKTAAFKNVDGSYAVVIINSGAANTVNVKITGVTPKEGSLYVSSDTQKCEKVASTVTDGTVSGPVPGKGMGTFFIPAPDAAATAAGT